MTVSTTGTVAESLCNGVTTSFTVPFQYAAPTDLVVELVDPAGVIVLSEGAHYFRVGDGMAAPSSVTTLIAYPAGTMLRRRRVTVLSQQLDLVPNVGAPAEAQERALDRVVLAQQEQQALNADVASRALTAPPGEVGGVLPPIAIRRGRYMAYDAAGFPIAATGVGADAALRGDLAEADGGAIVSFQQRGIGAARRTSLGKGRERVSVHDFGAIADGIAHPLSERFDTLASAKLVYPFATSLSQTIDWAAATAALRAYASNAVVEFSDGVFVFGDPVVVTGAASLSIVGRNATIKGGSARIRSYLRFKNCRRLSISGLTFDQLMSVLPSYTLADYAVGILNCPVEIDNCARVVVFDNGFDDLYTTAVYAYQSSDIAIFDNVFTSPVQTQMYWIDHIRVQTCAGLIVMRNAFMNAPIANAAVGCCSIFASGITRYASIDGNYSEYAGRDNTGTHRLGVIDFYGDAQTVRITNNTSRFGMAQFGRINAVRGGLVTGNRMHASPLAELDYSMLTIEGTVFFAPGQVGTADTIVRDNLFEDPAHRHAFAVGAIAYDWGVPILNVKILDNAFDGCRRSVLIRGPNYGCTVAGNSARGAAGVIQIDHQPSITSTYGSEAGSVFRALTIRDNMILDESGGGASAITIDLRKTPAYTGNVDHIRVEANTIRASSMNVGQAISVSLAADVAKGHVVVADNEIVNYAVGIYQREALIATLRNNRMLSCATPILDEGPAGTIERHGNRYSSGAMSGRATLAGGTATIPTIEVRTGDLGCIRVWIETVGGAPGFLSAGGINDAASFTINSTSNTDASTVRWQIDR